MSAAPVPLEHDEQVTFCQWLDVRGIVYFAVPNGIYTKLKGKAAGKQMAKMKAEGFKPGVPDLVVLLRGGKSVFVEMKRTKGSTVSTEQKRWLHTLGELGFSAFVCRGAKEAISVIERVIDGQAK